MKSYFPWLKSFAGMLLYILLHEAHKFFPGTLTAIFIEGGREESIFSHMKILFYTYMLISFADYLFRSSHREPIEESFLFTRLFILITVPWMMISIYYIPEAFGISLPRLLAIIFGILITWLSIYIAICLEKPLEKIDYPPTLKRILAGVFTSTLTIYTGFAFHHPHNEFFGNVEL